MRTLWLTILAATMAFSAHANPRTCDLEIADISLSLKSTNGNPQVLSTTRYGSDMSRVRRYFLTYSDGSAALLEQYGCGGNNIRLSSMSLQPMPTLLEVNRMAGIFKATTFWRTYFGATDPAPLLQAEMSSEDFQSRAEKSNQFFYNAEQRFMSPSVKNSAIVSFMRGNANTQFRGILTLTVGIEE